MDRETQVMAIELAHGEHWTYFPEDNIYGIATRLDLCSLQRAVAEMTVHAQLRSTPVPVPRPAATDIPVPAYPYRRVRLSGLPA